jgi:hypothetical protein
MNLNCLLNNCYSTGKHFISASVSGIKQEISSKILSAAKSSIFTFGLSFILCSPSIAQTSVKNADAADAYTRTINERAQKIVNTLEINNESKALRVRNIISEQYRNLNDIYTLRDAEIKAAKEKSFADEQARNTRLNAIQQETKSKLDLLHNTYLKKLSAELSAAQVDEVKDGMTYGVVHITYKGYQDMIPTLTEAQKKQIHTWLIEARELAMDAESSDKKHATFGKYKGRINNYLSAAGYDLKKAGEEWQARIKAEQAAKKQ